MGQVSESANAGVRQQPDGSWTWWARWLGGVEQSPGTYPDRQQAEQALREVLQDSSNP